MSYLYTHWAVRVRNLKPSERVVLMVLADITKDPEEGAEELGKSWLSKKQMEIRTELSEPTVRNALAVLEKRKLIFIDRESTANAGRHQYYINHDILEEEFEMGKLEIQKLDRESKEVEAERGRRRRDETRAKKARESFLANAKKQEEEHLEMKRKTAIFPGNGIKAS